MASVFVTGATGFVGRRLVDRLVEDGHDVTVLARDPSRVRELFSNNVSVIVGDVTDINSLKSISGKHFDFAYHLAAQLDESAPNLWEVNVKGTKNVLESLVGTGIERFVYLSSVGVLGSTRGPAREDMPYNPETRYEESKAEAERIITHFWLKYQIPYTIIRATIIYGPNKIFADILKAAESGYPLIGKGDNRFHLVYVDDVVDALLAVMSPIAKNKIYHVAGPDVYTYKETYAMMCKYLGVKMTNRSIPKSAAILAAATASRLSRVFNKKSSTTMLPSSIKRLTRDRVVDTSLIRRDLGWESRVKLNIGLEKTIKALRKKGML